MIEGVACTAATSARMIAAPVPSPATWTMRRRPWAASRPSARRPAGIAVEDDAVTLQLDDGGRRRRSDAAGDGGIAQPVAGRQRVGGMQGRPVVLAHGGGDAALGPGRSGALGQGHLGQQDDGPRREPERGHQAGKTAADDDGAAGKFGTHGFHRGLP